MNEQYIIEIEKNKVMIHQGDVFDQCSIGGDKNHYYQSGDLKNNELLIREIAGVYNIIPNSPNWKLNGNQLEEKKYYLLGRKNKLTYGKYTINIKKIKDISTGGLELDNEKRDIKELIGEKGTDDNIYNDVDIYNTPIKGRSKSRSSHQGYIKRLGFFANLSSLFFNLCLFYLCSWIAPLFPIYAKANEVTKKLDAILVDFIKSINPDFVSGNEIILFQKSLNELEALNQHSPILDQLLFPVIHGLVLTIIIKVLFAFVFGRPLPCLLLGVGIDGNLITKRLKAPMLEILNIILFPLNIYNLGGILPFKSLPSLLLQINLCRTSPLMGLIGPVLLFIVTCTLFTSPLAYQSVQMPSKITFKQLPKLKNKKVDTQNLEFSGKNLLIPKIGEMKIKKEMKKGKINYKLTSDKLKKSIRIKEGPLFISWANDFSRGNPIAFLTYPVHALKNIDAPIPNGNAELFRDEKIDMINKALQINITNLSGTILQQGFFVSGIYQLQKELQENLNLLLGNISAYWIKMSGAALVFVSDQKIYIANPVEENSTMIEITSSSKKDLVLFSQKFLQVQTPYVPPVDKPGMIESLLNGLEKLDLDELNLEKVIHKIDKLWSKNGPEFIKNLQNQQKDLTKSIKKATKAKEDALKEVDQE